MSQAGQVSIGSGSKERRSHHRYPVGLELFYKLDRGGPIAHQGSGKTLDFSEKGLLFQPDQRLPRGSAVELLIDWPVRLDGTPVLHAAISGRIVRSTANRTAVRIGQFRFLPGPARLKYRSTIQPKD
jgi:hypothetical protein